MNANTKTLGNLDSDPDVFVTGDNDGIAYGFVAGQLHQICHDQGIHPLLLAFRIELAKPQFHIIKLAHAGLTH